MTADREPAAEPLAGPLITALAGLPVGLITVTVEYGMSLVACVASTAAELLAVYRSRTAAATAPGAPAADVIAIRDRESGRRR